MPNKNYSDKQLIDRYLAGDKQSLSSLVKKWHKSFCEKAFWVLRDRELSKDVAQECWIIIIHKLPSLKKVESFKFWALRIVYTKAIDAHKKRMKSIGTLNTNDTDFNDLLDNETSSLLKKRLLKAIHELSIDKQEIIRLFYVEEYSLKEISSMLKIPNGTVKSRLFKAREKLKSIIKL